MTIGEIRKFIEERFIEDDETRYYKTWCVPKGKQYENISITFDEDDGSITTLQIKAWLIMFDHQSLFQLKILDNEAFGHNYQIKSIKKMKYVGDEKL